MDEWQKFLHRVSHGLSLTYQEAYQYTRDVLAMEDPQVQSAQLAVLLTSIMAKGPTRQEALGIIDATMSLDTYVPTAAQDVALPGVVGMAGSGKKGSKTCNLSTGAAIVAAAAGVPVAKSISHSTSSVAGSADVLHHLGYQIPCTRQEAIERLRYHGLGIFRIEDLIPNFDRLYGGKFYAPHVLSLGLPALLVPVKVNSMLYGISHPRVDLSLDVLSSYLDCNLLVISTTVDGYHYVDEVLLNGQCEIIGRHNGKIRSSIRVHWPDFLSEPDVDMKDLGPGESPQESACRLAAALQGRENPGLQRTIAANAALLMYLSVGADRFEDVRSHYHRALELIADGTVADFLSDLLAHP